MTAPTMIQVAERAGTTIATVSRVVNNAPGVSPRMRARVSAVVAELGYVPHASAQLLRTGRSRIIGIVVGDLANPRSVSLINSVQAVAAAHGLTALVASATGSEPDGEISLIGAFMRHRPAGLLVATLRTLASDRYLTRIADQGVPVVLVGRTLQGANIDSVCANYRRGGQLITRHLIALGHRRIAFVGAHFDEADRVARLRGYLDALQRARLAVRPGLVAGDGHPSAMPHYATYLTGYQATRLLLKQPTRPTAIVSRNDMVAVGAIQAAREAGLHVPDDISITGFDNIPLAAAFAPALTVMSQPTEEEGHLAAELLLARIERPAEVREPRELTLECNLIVRASTAPPAARRRRKSRRRRAGREE